MIEEDFKTIQKRFESYRNLINIQRFSNDRLIDHVQRISNQHKFNTEHVVPQSWFRAREPMKGDLHHLFACEPTCNSLRSNFPYYEYEVEVFPLNYRSDCGKQEMNRFEPSYGEGIVARATLYFLLRYPKKITRKFRKSIDIPLLTRWHDQFKVTAYEKHRNKTIFEIQGNRNPLISRTN
ncbi:endonuclease [Pseudogracilibacillus auburnensis]|uniref:Endonuclease I n=1 Tax=Pseudogracilibacillus auburnensis TaxID=1494959 RepID=A0A2V3W8M2_9BACI|nr:endonuclease I [Pseudogracilibacillus auburnensis]HLQ98180.1 endonuclease [Candidatus Dormibacteraeota bacterium]